MIASFGFALNSCSELSRPTPCDRECVSESLLRIRDQASGGSECWGAIVARQGGKLSVLTAAHCVSDGAERSPESVWVRKAFGQGESARPVRRVKTHTRFVRSPGSPYDLALLELDAWASARVLPLDLRRTELAGDVESFIVPAESNLVGDDIAIRLRSANSLVVRVIADRQPLCPGMSGAPVLSREHGGYKAVAVVSHGPSSCRGEVTAGRVHVAHADLFGAQPSAQTCAQCQAELASLDSACVTPLSLCEREPLCEGFSRCVANCQDGHCLSGCRAQHVPLGTADPGRRGAVLRCLCSARCVGACAAICR